MIIGVDPGTTTGLALYYDFERVTLLEGPWYDVPRLVSAYLDVEHGDVVTAVVCERYDITSGTVRKARDPDPYHVEGWCRLECARRGIFFMQESRADAKNFATDRKLQACGWRLSKLPHANDALRQVVTHLAEVDPAFRVRVAEALRG